MVIFERDIAVDMGTSSTLLFEQGKGIAGIFEDADGAGLVGREKLDVVFKAHEVGPDLLEALAVVFKEAVVNSQNLRREVENEVGHEKGQDKEISPLGIGDALLIAAKLLFVHGCIPPEILSISILGNYLLCVVNL